MAPADQKRKKKFLKKVMFRGIEIENLMDMKIPDVLDLLTSRVRRSYSRSLKFNDRRLATLMRRINKSIEQKKEKQLDKPPVVKTHLRRAIVWPSMIGAVIGVHNGKVFNTVEIRPEMVGRRLGEFSITYKSVQHGRPGVGATHSSRFVPLK